jgi:hypothetical protein
MRSALLAVSILAASVGLGACSGKAGAGAAGAEPALQKGSLANEQLVRDAMMGVSGKAATLGCAKIDTFQPYVLALPEGNPGARVWRERWVVSCAGHEYPINIRFNESGPTAADYAVE